jgi:hypothetical protein
MSATHAEKTPYRSHVRWCRPVHAWAGLALATGLLIYVIARPWAPLGLPALRMAPAPGTLLGFAIGSAPAFLHSFAFALLLGSLARSRAGAALACSVWAAIAGVIEWGQAPTIHDSAAGAILWVLPTPLAHPVGEYLRRGTFDPLDLAATGLGCFVAWRLLVRRFADAPQ